MKFKKQLKVFTCLFLSVVMFLVLQPFVATPSKVSIFAGETYHCNLFGPYTSDADTIDTQGDYEIPVRLLGAKVACVSVSVSEPVYLVPGGQAVGMKMHSDGPVVVGFEKIRTKDGEYDAKSRSGLCSGDRIIKVDNKPCTDTDDLAKVVSQKQGNSFKVTVVRDGESLDINVSAKLDKESGTYRLGVWLRDSSAGIGTVTFIDPKTGRFGALGHGICDQDTSSLIKVSDGKIVPAEVFDVKKGVKGTPGELRGSIKAGDKEIGNIETNTKKGVFGTTFLTQNAVDAIPVASKSQVKKGDAIIKSCVCGNEVCDYQIRITRINTNSALGFSGMEIEVTDPKLLTLTGGIVQGMSGSPIIQDGKLIGAVTHVFVNDPTKGYAIFITDMLDEAQTTQ